MARKGGLGALAPKPTVGEDLLGKMFDDSGHEETHPAPAPDTVRAGKTRAARVEGKKMGRPNARADSNAKLVSKHFKLEEALVQRMRRFMVDTDAFKSEATFVEAAIDNLLTQKGY